MAKKKQYEYQAGDVAIVRAKKRGVAFLPCFAVYAKDTAHKVSDGVFLKCVDMIEWQPDSFFYKMEIITGNNAGDTIMVPRDVGDLLEYVPGKLAGRR